jgi:hypothetical protein
VQIPLNDGGGRYIFFPDSRRDLANRIFDLYCPQAVTFRCVGGPGQRKNASENGHSCLEKPTAPVRKRRSGAPRQGALVPLPGRAVASRNPRPRRARSAPTHPAEHTNAPRSLARDRGRG